MIPIAVITGLAQAGGSFLGAKSQRDAIKEQNKRLERIARNSSDIVTSQLNRVATDNQRTRDWAKNEMMKSADNPNALSNIGNTVSNIIRTNSDQASNLLNRFNDIRTNLEANKRSLPSWSSIIGDSLIQGLGTGMLASQAFANKPSTDATMNASNNTYTPSTDTYNIKNGTNYDDLMKLFNWNT